MVYLSRQAVFDSVAIGPKMQNRSSKIGRGVTVNGSGQQSSKTVLNRQDRSSCSSTASCPVFSAQWRDAGEDLPPRCPSSLSSPTLQGPVTSQHGSRTSLSHINSTVNLKSLITSLQSSSPSLQDSVSNLKSFPSSSALQNSNPTLHSSTTSFCSSSTSFRSSSSSVQNGSSSEEDSWDTNSWSSGATCLLRSSIKQHSEEVFRVRASSSSRPEPASDSETGYQNSDSCQGSKRQPENQKTEEKASVGHKDSVHSQISSHSSTVASAASVDLEEKIEAKLKFSKFLDEVTCRVLDPERRQAFGAVRQKDAPVPSPQTSLLNSFHSSPVSCQPSVYADHWFGSNVDSLHARKNNVSTHVYQWNQCMPTCKILDINESSGRKHEEISFMESPRKLYLETDIDSVGKEDELNSAGTGDGGKEHSREWEREKRTLLFNSSRPQIISDSKKCPSAVSHWSEGSTKTPYHSTSLPRPVNSNLTTDGEAHAMRSMQEQKEDLRKHLSHTTHKLEMLEKEFDTTRQYLEAELRQAQEELDKFTDKLCRIQNSYAALQRINQDLEDKIHRLTQQYEEEKKALSHKIIALNDHLMEAKITIEKLREDNDLYRKDCNLAAQLLQRGKSHYKVHKLSELPTDFQERVSSHIQKYGHAKSKGLCHSSYSDVVPTAVIAKVLEKPEPGNSCPVTRVPSPQRQNADILPDGKMAIADTLRHHVYKSSDMYCSDTALYYPMDERRRDRWQERRQSVELHGLEPTVVQAQYSTDSNPEDYQNSFSQNDVAFHEFAARSVPASSSYSNFSVASDEKIHDHSSSFSSSNVKGYMDWREGDYVQKTSSYEKDSPGFVKSQSIHHKAQSPQKGNYPNYTERLSCYSEPDHSPQRTSCHNMGSSSVTRQNSSSTHIPDVKTGVWRQIGVKDVNTFPYYSLGCVSPYNFAMDPAKIKQGPIYSNLQEGDDVFHNHMFDACPITSPGNSSAAKTKHSLDIYNTDKGPMNRSKDNIKESNKTIKTSLFLIGSSKDKAGSVKEYTDVRPNNSDEPLNKHFLDMSNAPHYQLLGSQRKIPVQPQKFGTTGLSRKDSLTKAQLYGTLLN